MTTSAGLDPTTEEAALEGVMPWLAPTGLAAQALAGLDRPLLARQQDPRLPLFDSAAFYAEYEDEPGGLSRLEERIAELPPRPQWTLERIWPPDEETSAAQDAAYEKACVTLAGRRLHPRDLDAYTTTAYELAGFADQGDAFDPTDLDSEADLVGGDLEAALPWAAAAVCVLQQSLPYPFRDVLLYGDVANRPAHRALYAYATLLRLKHPEQAAPWFTAMVYLNPLDNMGARFLAPNGPSRRSPFGR
ncbi:hypothetical protein QNO07_26680 [Streptomyces sp. 549]|uniref:hypothetical protein n=1 Tax=Streptomyces sp. 549 TaxID=3049076 RepID=UPI0024C217D8|nr:hypothetical protein [Streptomyces sp. 549]MDK1476940.1 hypothetical protein [Streptomyces sp. 549]